MTSWSPTMPFQPTSTPATQPFGIVQSPGRSQVLRGLGVLDIAPDVVELDSERVGDQEHAISEDARSPSR